MGDQPKKIHLSESEMPTTWYNVIPDLPAPPPPPLHPGTREPVGPDDLAPLFPMALIEQEVSTQSYIDIPGEVLDVYRVWRPSPLIRATRLEGVSPAGSHKTNTSVPQAYYNHQEGIRKLTTETGAGQWGSALAFATAQYGMECEVWQVAASYLMKPYRRTMMEIWGAKVHSSPSQETEFGRQLLAENAGHTGSLGIAISEAVAACVADPAARYALGSVLNHVLLHQTIIGEEALLQHWVSRQRARELQISDDELVIVRTELDALHDDLYVLACAVEDTERDLAALGARPSAAEVRELLDWLLDAAKPLRDRQLSAPEGPPPIPS